MSGTIDASAWVGQDGEPRATLELTARDVRFLGGRGDVAAEPGGDYAIVPTDDEEIPF
ncbi:MAG: hypothetical protein M5R40_23170 [Anaerolineae bacterium]|nr:hypothetical protein [Anaerolineae bacterium]